jgi:hypothetical protein
MYTGLQHSPWHSYLAQGMANGDAVIKHGMSESLHSECGENTANGSAHNIPQEYGSAVVWNAARHEAEWHLVSAAGAHSKVWAHWAAAAAIHSDLMRLLGLSNGGVSTLGHTTESLVRILQLNASDSPPLAPLSPQAASTVVPRDDLRHAASKHLPQTAGVKGGDSGGIHSKISSNPAAHRASCNPAQRLALLHLTHELDSLLRNLKSALAGATDLALALGAQACNCSWPWS